MKVLIDNGHGKDTAGKRSPDGRLMEYSYTREIAGEIVAQLCAKGIEAELLVPEENDVPLSVRAQRANKLCSLLGKNNVVLVSVHCNAAGNGSQWMNATGWSAYTSKGRTRSDDLADILYEEAAACFKGRRIRTDRSDGDNDWEENFYILRKTACPAVLTENFFQDCRQDVEYLLSEEGRKAVIDVHVNALQKYVRRYG